MPMRREYNAQRTKIVDETVRRLTAGEWTARQAANHLRESEVPFNVAWRVILIQDMRRQA